MAKNGNATVRRLLIYSLIVMNFVALAVLAGITVYLVANKIFNNLLFLTVAALVPLSSAVLGLVHALMSSPSEEEVMIRMKWPANYKGTIELNERIEQET